ncbi:zinc-ribbon domain-containing protein [Kordia sp.]|uniref:zinc-ribbon domain-containing protein n=1 Tax=Kordia sp. TaxID=1965332 RepID=UPI003B5C7A6B
MIIYGGGSKDLGTRKLQAYSCSNCGASDVHVHAKVQYGTLFFIPLFPANKKYTSVCGNCNQTLIQEQMPQKMLDKLALEKHHFKSPIYLYSGIVLLILLVGFFVYSEIKDKQELEKTIQNLQPKSIIVFDNENGDYSFSKILEHNGDTIFVQHSNYVIDGYPNKSDYERESAKKEDFFADEIYYYLQKEIDTFYKNGEIENVIKY